MFNTQLTAIWDRCENLLAQFRWKIPVNTQEYFLFIDFCFNLYLPTFLFNLRHLTENSISYFHRKPKLIVAGGHSPEDKVTGS
jgi:hypothetical protein